MRFSALWKVWPALVLIFLVLGTIYLGIATPTESAAVGSIGTLLFAIFLYRTLNWKTLRHIFRATMLTTSMILLIFASAMLFGYVLTLLMVPQHLVEWVAMAQMPNWAVLTAIMAMLIVMGMFLDGASVILITVPILLPIIEAMGYDRLWFGVIMMITIEMAVITPPVGLNLYVIKGIAPEDISLGDIIRGAMPFVAVEIVILALFIVWPALALWLPDKMIQLR